MSVLIQINPMSKPRMVKSDAWKKRKCVLDYWAFKAALVLRCRSCGLELGDELEIDFILPIPKSWSEKKKRAMDGKPHKQKPDIDNLCKAAMDCLLPEDSHIWKLTASKKWGKRGAIIFY